MTTSIYYKISTLLPLDAICITPNCVVIGVYFATFVQKGGNRGTMLPQKMCIAFFTFGVARGETYSNPFLKIVAIG
jgi:hypothetical protein